MAKLKMTRVDYRLIHGQVAGQWTKFLDVDKVVIIDEESAHDGTTGYSLIVVIRLIKWVGFSMPGSFFNE